MAIINIPTDVGIANCVECIVCGEYIALEQATAGLRNLNAGQAFACNRHFKSGGQYIMGWADFVAGQRITGLHDGIDAEEGVIGGSCVGWAIY